MYTCIYACIHVYVYIHVYIHVYIYIFIYSCQFWWLCMDSFLTRSFPPHSVSICAYVYKKFNHLHISLPLSLCVSPSHPKLCNSTGEIPLPLKTGQFPIYNYMHYIIHYIIHLHYNYTLKCALLLKIIFCYKYITFHFERKG